MVAELSFSVPKDQLRLLIGHKGETISQLRQELSKDSVTILVPNKNDPESAVVLSGPVSSKLTQAKKKVRALIQQKVTEENEQRTMEIQVPFLFHSMIIGDAGSTVANLRSKYHVRIELPEKTEASNTIRILGDPAVFDEVKDAINNLLPPFFIQLKMPYIYLTDFSRHFLDRLLREVKMYHNEVPIRFDTVKDTVSGDPALGRTEVLIGGHNSTPNECYAAADLLQQVWPTFTWVPLKREQVRMIVGRDGKIIQNIRDKYGWAGNLAEDESQEFASRYYNGLTLDIYAPKRDEETDEKSDDCFIDIMGIKPDRVAQARKDVMTLLAKN